MITNGAAKPSYIFGISFCILLGGTLFSRIADGKSSSPAHRISADGVTRPGAIRIIHLPTPYPTGAAEADVLRHIAESLTEKPDAAVCVEWTENCRGRQRRNRATYFPERQVLRCERVGSSACEYNPVNPDAIDRALRDSADAAFFANANLYSMWRVEREAPASQ